jgi:hypothetical protein
MRASAQGERLQDPVATVEGAPGLVTVMGGKLARALVFTLAGGRVARIEVVGDPERLAALDLAPAPG